MAQQALPGFRRTVLLLVWATIVVPLIILCVYQLRADYERQLATYERDLAHETERLSFLLTQSLQQLMGDLDRIASDGSVIRSLSMPILTPISVRKIEAYLGTNPSVESVMLMDKEFFPIEVIPTWALTEDISSYEPYLAQVASSPASLSDPRPRLFLPGVAEAGKAQMLIFIRPILTASTSLSQPFQVDGLLLVRVNTEKLVQGAIDVHQRQPEWLRLLAADQVIFSRGEARQTLSLHHASINPGVDNQQLQLETGRPLEGILTQVLMTYRTQVIVVLAVIGLMVVVINKLADKVVRPLKLLDEQRAALQRLVQYAMQVHEADEAEALARHSLDVAQAIGRQAFGLYLLRSDFFSGCEWFDALDQSTQALLTKHHEALNNQASLSLFAETRPDLHLFPIGAAGDFQGFLISSRTATSEQAEEALMVLATLLSSALRQYRLNARLHQLAHLDSVTGLPNRHLFNACYKDRLANFAPADESTHFGVFVVDLNGLKFMNDHYGHQYGDQMLLEVARALKKAARANDTVARVGGDEFYLLLEQANESVCAAFAERLKNQCRDLHMMIDGQKLPVSFSMGFASTDKDSLKNLLLLADERMYNAKKQHYRQQAPVGK